MTAGNPLSNQTEKVAFWAAPAQAVERRTAAVEAVVMRAWEEFLAPHASQGLAVLAVGGFGRCELCPRSDVDLLLLMEREEPAAPLRSAISSFLQALWDSDLRASHSVRTVQECCAVHEQNIELNISLLDQRFLAGDQALYGKLAPGLARFFHSQRQALARHLCRLARERHAKQGGSMYQLEPNVKESPGGLRDLHLVTWLSQLRNTQPDRLPIADCVPELLPARDFLLGLRCYLHLRAGRDSNALTFDLQEEIADQFSLDAGGWMRRYYSHARQIERAAERAMESVDEQSSNLLLQFRDWRSRVSNAEFYVSRERVYFRGAQRLDYDPSLALRLFEFVGRHGMRLAVETGRRLAERLPRLAEHFTSRPGDLWPSLERTLASPHCALALRAMHQTGVLAALFPEWQQIECLVVRDFYHRYTVDEHSLRAIEALTSLRDGDDPSRRQFADILSEVDDPELLALALLFHDVGKAARTGSHVRESLVLAGAAMDRAGVPAGKRAQVMALIEYHLDLSAVMNSRDLGDPGTARHLAQRSGTLEFLKKLTLLTYADISAVNPGAMSPWRLEQLWRVYVIAYNELTRELETNRIGDETAAGIPGAGKFLEGFPVRYLRTHTPAEIEAHMALEQRSRDRGVAVDIRRENGFYRLTLVARDRPALLASLAGALAGFGMNILKAEGFANRNGVILDTFVFEDPHRTLELNPPEVDRLRLTLERVTLGKLDVKELLRNRPTPGAPSKRSRIHPAVSFDSRASDSATLIEVVAQDRPGLLHALTSTISAAGANIEVVLIDTEAHKAIDVFYVTWNGKKLTPAQQDGLRGRLMAACAPDGKP